MIQGRKSRQGNVAAQGNLPKLTVNERSEQELVPYAPHHHHGQDAMRFPMRIPKFR